MSTQFLKRVQTDLACQIIKEEYGEQILRVFEVVAKLEKSNLQNIEEQCKMQQNNQLNKPEQIREIIVLLLKNKAISVTQQNDDVIYMVDYQNVYAQMRHMQYINHIKGVHGLGGSLIVEFFTTNSSGTYQDCQQAIMEEYSAAITEEQIKKDFLNLVKNSYLTRDLSMEQKMVEEQEAEFQLPQQQKSEKKAISKNKRKRKDLGEGEIQDNVEKKQQLEGDQNPMFLQQLSQLQQMFTDPNMQSMMQSFNQMQQFQQQGGVFNPMAISQQQQPQEFDISQQFSQLQGGDLQQDQDENLGHLLNDQKTGEQHLFYINNRKFIHELRTKEICQVIEGKVGFIHKFIVQAMLTKSQKIGQSAEFKKTERLNLSEILRILPRELKNIRELDIKEGLDLLKIDGTKFISTEHINAVTHYSVNVSKIIKNIQFRHIAKIIERKYDVQTARIFRILKKYKCLDEKTVEELSLLTTDQVRSSLQTLVKDGLISYENAYEKDKQNASNFQAYSYVKQDVLTKIQEFYFQAIFNLKVKLYDQYQKSKEIEESINKKERIKEWQYILKMIKTLEIAVYEMDSALLCFTEY